MASMQVDSSSPNFGRGDCSVCGTTFHITVVKKEGPNQGREFFSCSQGCKGDNQFKGFWVEEWKAFKEGGGNKRGALGDKPWSKRIPVNNEGFAPSLTKQVETQRLQVDDLQTQLRSIETRLGAIESIWFSKK